MERMDLGNDDRLAALVEAAGRGEEAVLTRDGEVVAAIVPRTPELRTRDGRVPRRGIDLDALAALHASMPPAIRGADTAALIIEMRKMDDH